jgi:hypothetical protein
VSPQGSGTDAFDWSVYNRIPDKVFRRRMGKQPHVRRACRDNRPYTEVPFTIPGVLVEGTYPPMWAVDRDYWIAGISAEVGLHSEAHPNDGTPQSVDAQFNVRVWERDETAGDAYILNNNDRLRIAPGEHRDAVNELDDGILTESDMNLRRLKRGEHVAVQVIVAADTENAVITVELVPYPWPDRDELP